MILCSLWIWCNLEHLVNCYLLFSMWTFLLCKKKHFFKKFVYLFQRLSSTALLETLSLLLLFDILFSWWLGAELALNDHGKDSRRNWVKGSKNIMKSSLGSCSMCPLGIFLNFLFCFNFLVSKTQFKISMEKNPIAGGWVCFWWVEEGSLYSKTVQFSLCVPWDEEHCFPEVEVSSTPPILLHVVPRAPQGHIANGH